MTSRLIRNRILFTSMGLLGACIIAVVQYSSLADYTMPLIVSAACFSISIPMLAMHVKFLAHRSEGEKIEAKTGAFVLGMTGSFFAVAGFAALFYHIAIWLGILFVCASIISFYAVDAARNKSARID